MKNRIVKSETPSSPIGDAGCKSIRKKKIESAEKLLHEGRLPLVIEESRLDEECRLVNLISSDGEVEELEYNKIFL